MQQRKGAREGCEGWIAVVNAASEHGVWSSVLERSQLCQITFFKVRHFSKRVQELDVV